jgi:hypothetical protein
VIKEIRVHASDNQRRQLYKVMNEKPTNIVYLTDLVLSALSVHTVYEPLKTSMHHIQATSRRDITEIELAIFGKEARALLCTSTASWRNSRITLLRTLIENHPSRNGYAVRPRVLQSIFILTSERGASVKPEVSSSFSCIYHRALH